MKSMEYIVFIISVGIPHIAPKHMSFGEINFGRPYLLDWE